MNKDETKVTGTPKELKESKTQKTKVVTGVITECKQLNLRSIPKQENGNVIKELPVGTEVTIEETVGEFYKVSLPDGTCGFCMSKYIIKK